VQAHCFVNVSMEMIERSNVTFVTDRHILTLIIIIVAKLPSVLAILTKFLENEKTNFYKNFFFVYDFFSSPPINGFFFQTCFRITLYM
jgi:hypothetical protein